MATRHEFVATVDQVIGGTTFAWAVRDVTAGRDVACGREDDEASAYQAADTALQEARAGEEARLQAEPV